MIVSKWSAPRLASRSGLSYAGDMPPPVRRFGGFHFQPETGELFRSGERVELQNQPARVLELLTRRPGELVTRDELRQTVWGGDTYVDFDRSLNFCIRRIRVALGDATRQPTYLETLPRRGYRFVAPVTFEEGVAAKGSGPRSRLLGLAAAAFVLGFFGGAVLAEDQGHSSLHRRIVDWLHHQVLVPGEPCPWAKG
jgi:DNA-binding winged helix-turn-helix (wHTH) protein